jgi:adenylate kinase
VVLFFGPPGSGKSVQGELLVARNGWLWLSTGQLFRASENPEVLKRLETGELIDDELTNKVLDQALDDLDVDNRVVLDGYPRNPLQAEWLDNRLPRHGREIHGVIVFETPQDELVKRLSGRGRSEDTPGVIEKRLQIYARNTRPVLDFYRERGVPVFEINGLGTVEEVHERVQQAVEQCLPK